MAKAAAARLPADASAARGCEGGRRVLALLLAFSVERNTLSARDLAAATGIALPSVYRYLSLLRETGLLAEGERGSFRLSARLIGLARAAEAAESIIEVADPVMRELSELTGETVILVRLIGRAAVCVHRIESSHHLRTTFEPGQPLPLERGASARMLLAGLSYEARRQYLAPFAARDPEGYAELEEKVARAAEAGWAMSVAEVDAGVCAISAPVRFGKRMLASLTVPSPVTRTPPAIRERRVAQVRSAARDIGLALARQRDAVSVAPLCCGPWATRMTPDW
jgi:DNA-binding IclR family transcriptional regulator